ncbi:SEC-C domain-containing protein [Gemmatimonas sp.]|jgi:hypothetical protein|uniref:SEC-C domain-containing protein n=1 Tax=Gemmatimonas sp. TaxID=1962908 RepID=UPI0037BF7ACD
MRNDPCPCGSGKKFKKCHGAAMPPEVAALSTASRAEWQRAELLRQRQKRVGQDVLDWAVKKLGPEWTDAALDAWGLSPEEAPSDLEADIYTGWAMFAYVPPTLGRPIAAAWLDDAGARRPDDERSLVTAGLAMTLGIWEVETVEAGVGATLTDQLTGRTLFVHEPDLTHAIAPAEYICAYVLEDGGVLVFSGLHEDTLIPSDATPFVEQLRADAGGDAGLEAQRHDPVWQARAVRQWHLLAESLYADQAADGDEMDPDSPPEDP